MFYYNVTCSLESEIEERWLDWMQSVHIPEVMQTGCFVQSRLMRLIEPQNSNESVVYAIQYQYEKKEDFERYLNEFATALKRKTADLFGESVLPFRTHLQVLQTFQKP
jgi:hypothetical protein